MYSTEFRLWINKIRCGTKNYLSKNKSIPMNEDKLCASAFRNSIDSEPLSIHLDRKREE